MPDNTKEKKKWTKSDRALAYVLFNESILAGTKIGENSVK